MTPPRGAKRPPPPLLSTKIYIILYRIILGIIRLYSLISFHFILDLDFVVVFERKKRKEIILRQVFTKYILRFSLQNIYFILLLLFLFLRDEMR